MRPTTREIILVIVLGAAMLGSCALLWVTQPHGSVEQPPAMTVSDRGL